jgi:hypothetical protein
MFWAAGKPRLFKTSPFPIELFLYFTTYLTENLSTTYYEFIR